MSAGWGNKAVVVDKARLDDEIRKRGLRITALEQTLGEMHRVLGKDWRGRVAQDLVAELLCCLVGES